MDTANLERFQRDRFRYEPLPRLCDLDRLVDVLRASGLDGIVASVPHNVYYFTNYGPRAATVSTLQLAHARGVFVFSLHAPDHPVLVIPEVTMSALVPQPSWVQDVRPYALVPLEEGVDPIVAFHRFTPQKVVETAWGRAARDRFSGDDIIGTVRRAIGDVGLQGRRVAFDDPRFGGLVVDAGTDIVDGFLVARRVRQCKTTTELRVMRRAYALNEAAMVATIDSWSPDMTWRDFSHSYDVHAVAAGGFVDDPGGLILANPLGADPSRHLDSDVDDHPIRPGMHVMLDGHGTFQRYAWDGGKTWIVGGDIDNATQRVIQAAKNAFYDVQSAAVPGVRASHLYDTAVSAFRRSRVPNEQAVRVFFHSTGVEHIEMGLWPGDDDWQTEPGMVISVHLIYLGGDTERYWLEDSLVVGATSSERLYNWDLDPFTAG